MSKRCPICTLSVIQDNSLFWESTSKVVEVLDSSRLNDSYDVTVSDFSGVGQRIIVLPFA